MDNALCWSRASEAREVFPEFIWKKFLTIWPSPGRPSYLNNYGGYNNQTKKKRCAHFYIEILNQSIEPIYPKSQNFHHFPSKLNFVSLISPKLSKLEIWNQDKHFSTFVEHNSLSFMSDRPCVMTFHFI